MCVCGWGGGRTCCKVQLVVRCDMVEWCDVLMWCCAARRGGGAGDMFDVASGVLRLAGGVLGRSAIGGRQSKVGQAKTGNHVREHHSTSSTRCAPTSGCLLLLRPHQGCHSQQRRPALLGAAAGAGEKRGRRTCRQEWISSCVSGNVLMRLRPLHLCAAGTCLLLC